MKKLAVSGLVAGALLGALSPSPALAADLGGRPIRPPRDFAPPYEPPSRFSRWTGFYLGGTLGYSWGDVQASGDIGTFAFDQDGINGTLFAGYNWQVGAGVLGLEADIGTGGYGSRTALPATTLETDLTAIGSLRARAGFLLTPALLLYATGGLAWANMDYGFAGQAKVGDTLTGYQVGAGTELLFTNNVSLRLEYIYTDLEKQRFIHSGQTNFYDPDFHTVRAGIAFKF